MTSLTPGDIEQMRGRVFFEGPERGRRLSRYWLLLLLSAVIATAGVVSDFCPLAGVLWHGSGPCWLGVFCRWLQDQRPYRRYRRVVILAG